VVKRSYQSTLLQGVKTQKTATCSKSLKANKTFDVHNLHSDRKIIRRIYGPVRQGREWRIRNNEEIDNKEKIYS
jgi:hypothetical protein